MNAELTHHLGYEKHDPSGYHNGNSRNGSTGKTVKSESARWSWAAAPRRELQTADKRLPHMSKNSSKGLWVLRINHLQTKSAQLVGSLTGERHWNQLGGKWLIPKWV